MTKIYRSAMGKSIDIDNILLKNETVIAVGNMKVNARGDELGPGGKIVKTRDQIMKEYYALNTPVATDPMDTMKPDDPAPTKPVAQTAMVKQEPVAAPPVVINPDSGLDDDDDGPAVVAIPQLPIEEVLVAPTPQYGLKSLPEAPPISPLPLRGSLAGSVAKTATVTQTEKLPMNKANGVQRF